jgi:outer membrane lipoprotein SlyB
MACAALNQAGIQTKGVAAMNAVSEYQANSRIHPLVAAAAVSIILACGTGVAAMAGLLPSSKATATTVTASPLVDTQAAKASAPAAPLPRAVRGHHVKAAPAAETQPVRQAPAYDPYAGEVTAINAVQSAQPTSGLGAIGGAVVGGLAGTQIGNGRGKTAATIIGAIGGGLAGNQIEHVVHKTTTYQVQVRMNDGSIRTFNYDAAPGMSIGQHVRVSGETLTPA